MKEKIELLPVSLLDQNRAKIYLLKNLARSLNLEFGWHYLLDLTWIISELGPVEGRRIVDAGAGTGILQWYLAQQGAEVISIDRGSRAELPLRFRTRFRVRGLRKEDLVPSQKLFRDNFSRKVKWRVKMTGQVRDLIGLAHLPSGSGRVYIYNQDLKHLTDLRDDSVDAIVAVSALEHNPPETLEAVVAELMRVLKPGGVLLATLTAGRDRDWWHEASSGWCYSEASLRRLFCLPPEAPSNYAQYDQLFAELRGSTELREGLARFYYASGKNGMPWGVWDPQYMPVGVCKLKKQEE